MTNNSTTEKIITMITTELKKESVQNKIYNDILSPILYKLASQYYYHYIFIIMLQIIIVFLLILIILLYFKLKKDNL